MTFDRGLFERGKSGTSSRGSSIGLAILSFGVEEFSEARRDDKELLSGQFLIYNGGDLEVAITRFVASEDREILSFGRVVRRNRSRTEASA